MILRCIIDGLLLDGRLNAAGRLVVRDADDEFALEAIEAQFYQLVQATETQELALQTCYRLLRRAEDFHLAEAQEFHT